MDLVSLITSSRSLAKTRDRQTRCFPVLTLSQMDHVCALLACPPVESLFGGGDTDWCAEDGGDLSPGVQSDLQDRFSILVRGGLTVRTEDLADVGTSG